MSESKLEKIKAAFWVIYILIPIFTGWMTYQYLPNEYDERKHELLESHHVECGTEGMQSCVVPDKWRNKISGKIYTSSQFASHRRAEAERIAIITFAYGLIGCLFAAYWSVVRHRISMIKLMQKLGKEYVQHDFYQQTRKIFFGALKTAFIVDFFISLFVYWMI